MILKKTIQRRKQQARSRTIARPALLHQTTNIARDIWRVFGIVLYLLSVLILFQFFCVQFVLGFSERRAPVRSVLPSSVPRNDRVATSTAVVIGKPARLKIPVIQVDAVIRPVGLTSNGSMGVPTLPLEAAWYMLGPKPGETGSAVIAGHVDWWYGAKGVFEKLKTIKPGTRISVQDEQGRWMSFVVRGSRLFGQKDDATEVFRSYDGKSHLNLVTCIGVWDKAAKAYAKRLVVFADRVLD